MMLTTDARRRAFAFILAVTCATPALAQQAGIRHDYAVGGNGAHDWATWRWLLNEKLLPNLFRPRK